MQQFFSSFLKHKKTIFFVFLFLVISGIILPKFVLGAQTAAKPLVSFSEECSTKAGINKWVAQPIPDPSPSIGINIFKAFLYGLAFAFTVATSFLLRLSASILIYAMNELSSLKITSDQGVFYSGWIAVKGLGNMLIVLGFVIVGIATALRIRDYEAKKLLWPLIAIALLINFSGLFCGLIIDAANLIMNGLPMGDNSGGNIIAYIYNTFACVNNSTMINDTNNFLIFIGDSFMFGFICVTEDFWKIFRNYNLSESTKIEIMRLQIRKV